MSPRRIRLSDPLYAWLLGNTVREAEPLHACAREPPRSITPAMQIAPEQGQLMALLVKLIGKDYLIGLTFVAPSRVWPRFSYDTSLTIRC